MFKAVSELWLCICVLCIFPRIAFWKSLEAKSAAWDFPSKTAHEIPRCFKRRKEKRKTKKFIFLHIYFGDCKCTFVISQLGKAI